MDSNRAGKNLQRNRRRLLQPCIEALESRRLLTTIYVDGNSPAVSPDGASWATAYKDLQTALVAIASTGGRINVADGTYTPGSTRSSTFQLLNNVALYGGYAGYGPGTPDARDTSGTPTILSGEIGNSTKTTDNIYQIVTASGTNSTAVLDGFTITGANGNTGGLAQSSGAGIYNSGGSPVINNCLITGNLATIRGAGMANINGAAPTLTNCVFRNNSINAATSNGGGGGMYSSGSTITLTNCTFDKNSVLVSSGGSTPNMGEALNCVGGTATLTNCTFSQNTGGFEAAQFDSSNTLTATNCSFIENDALSARTSGNAAFANCIFSGNGAAVAISGTSSLKDCVVTATRNGGVSLGSGSPKLINCTIYHNALNGGNAISNSGTAQITNSIVWGNSDLNGTGQIFSSSGSVTATYCDIQDGFAGTGNVNVNPEFVRIGSAGPDGDWGTADDDRYGDLRIASYSPLVDGGNNAAMTLSTDLAGNNRFVDVPSTADTGTGSTPIIDMGAYEAAPALAAGVDGPYLILPGQASITLHGYASSTASGTFQFDWDFNGDGVTDATGPNPLFSTSTLPVTSITTVRLIITDSASNTATASTTVTVEPPVLYVDQAATGANTGFNWTDALPSLNQALTQALPGQEIHVAGGTYKTTQGTNRLDCFQLKSGVSVYGGYAGSAVNPELRNTEVYQTLLSGEIGSTISDYSSHVVLAVNISSGTTFDGFTVRGVSYQVEDFPYGGHGIYVSGGAPTISHCIFDSNNARQGAAIYGDITSMTLYACTFSKNVTVQGAAVYIRQGAPTILNCVFEGNTTTGIGAALSQSSTTTITNSIFVGNFGQFGNGAIAPNGGAFTNCIIASNVNGGGGTSGPSPTFVNCILFSDSLPGSYTYSDVPGASTVGGNINADPLFVRNPSIGADGKWGTADDDYGDLRLQAGSPCIDAGKNAAVPVGVTTDLGGSARFIDNPETADAGLGSAPMVDMGAYEKQFVITSGTLLPSFTQPSVRFTFSSGLTAATLGAGDLILNRVMPDGSLGSAIAAVDYGYEAATKSASFLLPSSPQEGRYRATLAHASVNDAASNPLSADCSFDFYILTADANGDGKVNDADFAAFASHFGQGGQTYGSGDFNGDGFSNTIDFNLLSSRFGTDLTVPAAAVPIAQMLAQSSSPAASLFSNSPVRNYAAGVLESGNEDALV